MEGHQKAWKAGSTVFWRTMGAIELQPLPMAMNGTQVHPRGTGSIPSQM
jgi:hypothetical protein